MTIEITVSIKNGKGAAKTYLMRETAKPVKNDKTGKTTLAHFQPAEDCAAIKPFSKLYINIAALKGS